MIVFFTWTSNSVPLLEGLCSSNPCSFESSDFWVFAGIEPTTSGLTVIWYTWLTQSFPHADSIHKHQWFKRGIITLYHCQRIIPDWLTHSLMLTQFTSISDSSVVSSRSIIVSESSSWWLLHDLLQWCSKDDISELSSECDDIHVDSLWWMQWEILATSLCIQSLYTKTWIAWWWWLLVLL